MPQRPKIAALPKDVKTWLEQALIKNNFAQYKQLAQLLADKGFTIGKSAIQRYGAALERRISAIKASTEAAAMIADAAPDDEDKRSGAVLSLIQTEIFEAIMRLQEAEDADPATRMKLLSAAAKNIATMTRASVTLKRYQAEVRVKVRAAADAAARIGKKGGLSKQGAQQLYNVVMGIAN